MFSCVIHARNGRDIFSDICEMFGSVLSIYKYRLFGTQGKVKLICLNIGDVDYNVLLL